MRWTRALIALGLSVLTGCSSIGPTTVAEDRTAYGTAIGDSWKRQALLNIVKMRYLDPPIFVEVGQIVAGYSLERAVEVYGEFAEFGAGDRFAGASGSAVFTDRPTITYTPMTGNDFIRALMTPLTPESVFFVIESGWPADVVLLAAASSINGLRNQESSLNGTVPPDPRFLRVLTLMRNLQAAGGVSMRIQQGTEKQQTTILTFRGADYSQQSAADRAELRELLKLNAETSEFRLVFGTDSRSGDEIALQTRSIIRLMGVLSAQIEVPIEDINDTRTPRGIESLAEGADACRMMAVHSSAERPVNAYVAVRYRNLWFWIDDRDLNSKRYFGFIMLLMTLAESGEKKPIPLITIPAQ